MKISTDAMKFLVEQNQKSVAIVEEEIPTCCSVIKKPMVFILNKKEIEKIQNDEEFSSNIIVDGVTIYCHKNAKNYLDEGEIIVEGYSHFKSLTLSHPDIDNNSLSSC